LNAPSPILATPHQLRIEERAAHVFASANVRQAMELTSRMFHADANAARPDQSELIRTSVQEHYFHASMLASNESPRDPGFAWSVTNAHRWMGRDVPGNRFGQDNTDNIYRMAAVDSRLGYRIVGQLPERPPCDFSICALPAHVGEGILADVLAICKLEDLEIGPDCRFEILADSSPTAGRRNHICIANARTLMVRDTLADWAAERPLALKLEYIDGPAVDDFDAGRAAVRAAQLGKTIAEVFFDRVQHAMFDTRPANLLAAPVASAGRGGLVTQAATLCNFDLRADEALIVDADRLGARYVGMQICDFWMLSYECRDRTSSLNHAQAIPDSDGRYRWVIAASDPGVHNWLDSSSQLAGSILLRWQHAAKDADLANAVATKRVKFADLHSQLPADTAFVDESGRQAQRKQRLQDYQRRLS
jgi:hypothetical protein